MTRTLVVGCADWSVRAAGHAQDDRPVAVRSHHRIVATNPAARAVGVRIGLRRREAQGRCPELLLVPDDPQRDAHCFEPIVTALDAFTPDVEVVRPGTAAFGTRGPSRYFGGDDALAARVHRTVSEVLGDPSAVRVGVADGPLIARLAATGAEPGTTRVVPVGGAPNFVAPIRLSSLGRFAPDPDVLTTWVRLGLHTLGEVAALPAAAVLGRFGHDGIWLHRLACGVDPTVSSPTPIPPDVDEVVDFDPPEIRAEAVAFVARAGAQIFVDRLAGSGLSCAQVVITLSSDDATELRRRWRLDGPGRSGDGRGITSGVAGRIAERVRWQTDGWLSGSADTRPSDGIIRVRLSPGEVRPARGTQPGFWGGASAADEQAARAVARLEALLGPDAVRVVEPRGGRHPVDDARLVPTASIDLVDVGRRRADRVDRRGRAATPADPPWPGRLPAPSAATVLPDTRPVEVVDDAGRHVEVSGRGELSAPPVTLRWDPRNGPEVAITAWAGPWPVDERWWSPEGRRRQARLQLVTASGEALLVARHDRRWWLTAVYD